MAVRLVQIGIRTLTAHQREQAKKFGVEIYDATRGRRAVGERRSAALSLNRSRRLDRRMLPACRIRGRGACPRARLSLIRRLPCPSPGRTSSIQPEDECRPTARVAAKMIKEVVA